MKIRNLFLLCSVSTFLISCFIKKTLPAPNVRGTKWMLVSLGNTTANVGELNSSIHFKSNGEIHAIAVCNTISGKYSTNSRKRKLHMSALMISYLGCYDLKTEAMLSEAIKATNKYLIREDTLLLLHNGEKLATYSRTRLP